MTEHELTAETLTVTYTNYRGETAVRKVQPLERPPRWGTTEHHSEPQWLLDVYDWDKEAVRTYALKDCDFTNGRDYDEITLAEFVVPVAPMTQEELNAQEAVAGEDIPDLSEEPFLSKLADAVGGTIDEVGKLPDGSGFATLSMPLPRDHWLYAEPESGAEAPPMPLRMLHGGHRHMMDQRVRAAARYAIRFATMRGREADFDPDAMVQNFVVGMLGYHTHDGLSHIGGPNPDPVPPVWWPDSARGDLTALAEKVAKWREVKSAYSLPQDPDDRARVFHDLFAAEQDVLNHDKTER
jgi:hypothetical protein